MGTLLTDVGKVVEIFLGGAGDRVQPATADDAFSTPPVGVMLTNAGSPDTGLGGRTGGDGVVGCSEPLVVRLSASSGTPTTAAKLYLQRLSADAGGASDKAERDPNGAGPCPLGYCLAEGPSGATALRYMTWEPQPPDAFTLHRDLDMAIGSSTALVDFVVAPVKAGRRYRLDSLLFFDANAAGGIDATISATDVLNQYSAFGEMFGTFPAALLASASPLTGGTRVGAAGPTRGFIRLTGMFTPASDCNVSVQASQHASNIAATTVYKESWMMIKEV